MKITSIGDRATVARLILIQDGPVLDTGSGRKFRPNLIRITYTLNEGEWGASAWGIRLSGLVLRRDGTEGHNTHSRTPEYSFVQQEFTEDYRWINEIVDRLRPAGAPVYHPQTITLQEDRA